MSTAPSVLLLDDGELDRVAELLDEVGANAIRLQHRKIVDGIKGPRDLLISSGRWALKPPQLSGEHQPTRVCFHNQDFQPLRERLRAMGVDYLIHSQLNTESLRAFLRQLLHRGAERRRSVRLPLHCEARYRVPASEQTRTSRLMEISREGALVQSLGEFPEGARMSLILPRVLGGGKELEIAAHVLFNRSINRSARHQYVATGLSFRGLRGDEEEKIDAIISGRSIATVVTPLSRPPTAVQPPPAPEAPAEETRSGGLPSAPTGRCEPHEPELRRDAALEAAPTVAVAEAERRSGGRIPFSRPVATIGCVDDDKSVGVGCDLSPSGIRILECSGLSVGEHVTLAIYPVARQEPTLVIGRVVRVEENSAALAFEALTPDIVAQIERLAQQHPIESLRHGGVLLVTHSRAVG